MTPDPQSDLHPFAGRESLYARLYQHALDPPERRALVITGREGSGKTALLKQFDRVFDDTLLSLYISLEQVSLRGEDDDWLIGLVEQTNALLSQYDFSLYRVPELNTDTDDDISLREWVRDVYLPDVFRVIRSQRRLVWLLDDAAHLLDAATAPQRDYLYELLQAHEQLALVLTLPIDREDHLPELVPLVNPTEIERLYPLNRTDCGVLMRQFAPGLSDDAVERVHHETGGHPPLLQRYGQALADHWQDSGETDAMTAASKIVYQASHDDFRRRWLRLSRDERLVLTALASLLYDRPDRPVTSKQIEKWLIETDFPLDMVAINAALRSLDYQEMVQNSPQAIRLRSGFLQTWLMEHARLDDSADSAGEDSGGLDALNGRVIALLLLAGLVILLALLFLPELSVSDPGSALPTVTISGS